MDVLYLHSETHLPVLDQHFRYTLQGLPLQLRILMVYEFHDDVTCSKPFGNRPATGVTLHKLPNIIECNCCHIFIVPQSKAKEFLQRLAVREGLLHP